MIYALAGGKKKITKEKYGPKNKTHFRRIKTKDAQCPVLVLKQPQPKKKKKKKQSPARKL